MKDFFLFIERSYYRFNGKSSTFTNILIRVFSYFSILILLINKFNLAEVYENTVIYFHHPNMFIYVLDIVIVSFCIWVVLLDFSILIRWIYIKCSSSMKRKELSIQRVIGERVEPSAYLLYSDTSTYHILKGRLVTVTSIDKKGMCQLNIDGQPFKGRKFKIHLDITLIHQ